MIEFKTEYVIIAFDGRIIAIYHLDGRKAEFYHIDFVAASRITTTRKGRPCFELTTQTVVGEIIGTVSLGVYDPKYMPQLQTFVAAVNNAVAARP